MILFNKTTTDKERRRRIKEIDIISLYMLRPSPLRRNREYDRNKKMEVSSVRYPRGHAIVQLSVSIVVAVTNYYPGAVVIIVWLQTSNCRRDGGRDGERERRNLD